MESSKCILDRSISKDYLKQSGQSPTYPNVDIRLSDIKTNSGSTQSTWSDEVLNGKGTCGLRKPGKERNRKSKSFLESWYLWSGANCTNASIRPLFPDIVLAEKDSCSISG